MAKDERKAHSPERLQRSQQKILEQHAHLDAQQLDVRVALADGDVVAAEHALRAFGGAVEAHFALEESAYYPETSALDADLAAILGELMTDHETMRDQIGELRRALQEGGLPALRDAFDAFISTLDDHETREEKTMELIASRA